MQVRQSNEGDGKPDNLFRGSRLRDGKRLIIKAVGIYSHELDVVQYLSSPGLRCDPANHTIRKSLERNSDDAQCVCSYIRHHPSSSGRAGFCCARRVVINFC